jgi:DNA-binding response OmpR family regulator
MLAILLIGVDLRLLATRAAVLSKVDAEVDLGRPEELTARMSERHYDLLVLCHTLREKDAEAITQLARQRWPETRILQIVRERWMEKPLRMGIAALSTPEPRRLVERTRELFPLQLHRM